MFSKINPKQIITDHFDTFTNHRTGKPMKTDYLVFFGIPLVVAIILVIVCKIKLDHNAGNILITSLSIFAALLFNLLLLVYDIVHKENNNSTIQEALKQIFANISFSIFISIITIFLLLVDFFFDDVFTSCIYFIASSFDFVIYWFIALFTLTLLMILKRIHSLLSNEFLEIMKNNNKTPRDH